MPYETTKIIQKLSDYYPDQFGFELEDDNIWRRFYLSRETDHLYIIGTVAHLFEKNINKIITLKSSINKYCIQINHIIQ